MGPRLVAAETNTSSYSFESGLFSKVACVERADRRPAQQAARRVVIQSVFFG